MAPFDKGTIVAFNAGMLVNGGIVSGGFAVGSGGFVFASGIPILVENAPLFAGGISYSGTISAAGNANIDIGIAGVSTFTGGITNSKGGLIRDLQNGGAFAFGAIGVRGGGNFSGGVRNAGTISTGGKYGIGIVGTTNSADLSMTFTEAQPQQQTLLTRPQA
jgi:hypothetical protein